MHGSIHLIHVPHTHTIIRTSVRMHKYTDCVRAINYDNISNNYNVHPTLNCYRTETESNVYTVQEDTEQLSVDITDSVQICDNSITSFFPIWAAAVPQSPQHQMGAFFMLVVALIFAANQVT